MIETKEAILYWLDVLRNIAQHKNADSFPIFIYLYLACLKQKRRKETFRFINLCKNKLLDDLFEDEEDLISSLFKNEIDYDYAEIFHDGKVLEKFENGDLKMVCTKNLRKKNRK